MMRMVLLAGLTLWRAVSGSGAAAQDAGGPRSLVAEGLAVGYGIGGYAYTDHYISGERYSGGIPYYQVAFTKRHDTYVYRIGAAYRQSDAIRNHMVSAEIYEFGLNQGFLYPLRPFSLFSRRVQALIGPTTDLYVFLNKQNIAVSGFDYAQSFAALFSLGIRSELLVPLSDHIQAEGGLAFGVLSLGLRMVDMEEDDESPAKLLTLLSGSSGFFSLGARYRLSDRLSVKAAYLLGLTRIEAWEPLHAASDHVAFSMTWRM